MDSCEESDLRVAVSVVCARDSRERVVCAFKFKIDLERISQSYALRHTGNRQQGESTFSFLPYPLL